VSTLYKRAVDPYQYDLDDLDWTQEALVPIRKLHFNYHLLKHIENLRGKRCLDIGCGDGQLPQELSKLGAEEVIGIEPSRRSVENAKAKFPNLVIVRTTLQDCVLKKPFDVVTCIMVLNHIANVHQAFAKIRAILKNGGKAYIMIEDFDYFKTPRHGYEFKLEKRSKDEWVIAVKRRYGLVADVIRPVSFYKKAARAAGLISKKHVRMKFTRELLKVTPRYQSAKDLVVNHLLVFKKP